MKNLKQYVSNMKDYGVCVCTMLHGVVREGLPLKNNYQGPVEGEGWDQVDSHGKNISGRGNSE